MLGLTNRRILLSAHILLNAILLGALIIIFFLNNFFQSSAESSQLFGSQLTIFRINDLMVTYTAFAVIVTGLLFSLFTKWGFFDFYWITVKWIGLILLFVVISFFLSPAINGLSALSDLGRMQPFESSEFLAFKKSITFFSSVSVIILIFLVVISVFKPWGKRKKLFSLPRKVVVSFGSVLGLLVIFSAVMQFSQLKSYRSIPIKHIDLHQLPDGDYQGEADLGYSYKVQVSVANQEITAIKIVQNRSSFYAKLAESIIQKVIAEQTPNVEAVTGATTTSKCLQKAIENALERSIKNF